MKPSESFQQYVPRLERLVEATAKLYGKKVDLIIVEHVGRISQEMFNKMLIPLEHLLFNATIHGIESPEERQSKGKLIPALITVSLQKEEMDIVIKVTDDGAGMNDEIMQQIFVSGFTTLKEKTRFAGRGNGMNIIANPIKELGGTLDVSSEEGNGTTFTIRLPLVARNG